jgi:hypothetical protein
MKDFLTPEERGTYFLLQKKWARQEQVKQRVYLLVLLAITTIVLIYGN